MNLCTATSKNKISFYKRPFLMEMETTFIIVIVFETLLMLVQHNWPVFTRLLSKCSLPFLQVEKEKVSQYSDVVLPQGCDMAASTWLLSQPERSIVTCRNDPTRHGMQGKDQTMPKVKLY